jgi:mRNA-degrading endonuclease HigB of HigAB toxin-antitoxin module
MAYTLEQWQRARAYYEAGLTLRDIEKKTGINYAVISKKAKKQQWQQGANADYIEAKVTIAEKKATKNATEIQALDEIADEAISNKKLVFNVTTKALKKVEALIDEITNPNDLRTIVEMADKASLTLGVNARHSNQQINVQTNTQVNNIKEGLKSFYENVSD